VHHAERSRICRCCVIIGASEYAKRQHLRGVAAVRVVVVGAGVGGLTAALSLHSAGTDVVVGDAVRDLLPLGVGINLQPHAVRELTELGLGRALEATGIQTREMLRLDRYANRIVSHDRGRFAGYAWPQYSIHRGELQMLL
jgi:2-polyprenyl-6-methoxyphenol hydroxylase-like FAD-dependent oxidoreductase